MRNKLSLELVALGLGAACTLFAVMVISYLIGALDEPAPYWIGEWQINYAAGFVRRGLLGEFARVLFAHLAIDTRTTIVTMQVLSHVIFFGASMVLLTPVLALHPRFAFAALGPMTIAFAALDLLTDQRGFHQGSVGAKDVIFLALLAVQAVLCSRDSTDPAANKKRLIVLSVVCGFVVLVHEGFLFFLPFSLACLVLTTKKRITPSTLMLILLPAIVAFVATGVFHGDSNYSARICASLGASAPADCPKTGAIAYIALPAPGHIMGTYYQIVQPPYILLTTMLAASLGGVGLALALTDAAIAKLTRDALQTHQHLLVVIACILIPIPLFALSDHGRFLHIWFTSASTVIAAFLSRNSSESVQDPATSSEGRIGAFLVRMLWIALFVGYATSWSVQGACCPDRLGSGFLGEIASVVSQYFQKR